MEEQEPLFKVEDVEEEETYPYIFDFYESDYRALDLDSAVFQAMGAASTCWENMKGAGEFQSEHAVIIGNALIAKIKEFCRDGKIV